MVFGLFRKTFSAGAFTLLGVYLGQNYKLPDVGATAAALVSPLTYFVTLPSTLNVQVKQRAYLSIIVHHCLQYRTAGAKVEEEKKK